MKCTSCFVRKNDVLEQNSHYFLYQHPKISKKIKKEFISFSKYYAVMHIWYLYSKILLKLFLINAVKISQMSLHFYF